MSLASYIGTNIPIPYSKEDSNETVFIGDCFASKYEKENVKKHQFSTSYVYEVSTDWGIEISENTTSSVNQEPKEKLLYLCELMDHYLTSGDYFELYSCWVGEECEQREKDFQLVLHQIDMNQLYIPERTLVRIRLKKNRQSGDFF